MSADEALGRKCPSITEGAVSELSRNDVRTRFEEAERMFWDAADDNERDDRMILAAITDMHECQADLATIAEEMVQCPLCQGTGTYWWIKDSGSYLMDCECQHQTVEDEDIGALMREGLGDIAPDGTSASLMFGLDR